MKKLLLATCAAVCFTSSALAADAPDKSDCNLFDPTPDSAMRSFSTDRPTKSDSPYTVDCGHFQYESDIVNWTYDRYNGSTTTTSNILVANSVLKAGLTNNTDLEIAFAPLAIDQTHDRSTGSDTAFAGVSDIFTRLKVNLLGNDGGDYALAIVPYVKAPSANSHIGNGHWEGGGYVPFAVALPRDWTLNITSEMDILENAAQNGMHTNFSNLINFSHPLFDPSVTGYVEFWSDVNNDAGASTQYTGDFAVSWAVRDNLQLDAGINIGLNKAAPDAQAYLGISQRF